MILNLNKGFIEIRTSYPNFYYYQNNETLVELKLDEDYNRVQIELKCQMMRVDIREFDKLYDKFKKHVS